MTRHRVEKCDRFWLLTLAMGALVVLGGVSLMALWKGVPEKADVLIGGIVTGLLLFMREIVQAIRGFWQDERTGKLTDQLAAAPATEVNVEAKEPRP